MTRFVRMLALVVALLMLSCCFALADSALPADVQAIVDRGVLNVGVKADVLHFGYFNTETGDYEGLEVAIARKIAEALGVSKVKFTAVTAATRGQLLDAGDIDMVLATFTITEERKLTYNFSTPYYTDAVTVMVMADAGIASLKDLNGMIVGVATSSTSSKALAAAAGDDVKMTFEEFATYPEIKLALTMGGIDAFCVDGSILSSYLDETTVLLDERFSPQMYGVTTKLANTGLAAYVDGLITAWLADGTIDALIADNGAVASFAE